MRPFLVFKKLFLSLCFVLAVFYFNSSFGQSLEDVKNKIDQTSSDIARLEAEIKSYQKELNSISTQKNTLSSSIKLLDITRKKLVADISLTEKKIIKTNKIIKDLSLDIGDKETSINNSHQALIFDINNLYELEETSLAEILIRGEDLTSIWNDLDHMAYLREAIITKVESLKQVKGELEDTRGENIQAKNELVTLKAKLADDKKIVEQNTKEKNKLLKQTKNSEANYQKLLKSRQATKLALERELRDYESELKFILDPSSLPKGGILSWPLDDVYVTQLFGKTVDAKRLYASGSHSGVDFRASIGTPIKAMSDGIVLGVGDTDVTCPGASFGKWVFIEYKNGLSSTFGHLSLIKAYEGQKVSRGEIVGYSGATGHVTGPHLHVTVYASGAASVKTVPSKSCVGKTLTQPLAATNAYLDPMYYLPPYKN